MTYTWPLMQDGVTHEDKELMTDFLMKSSRLTQGEKVAEFEEAWSKWQGCKYSVFVNSGSSANLLLVDAVREMKNLKSHYGLVPACTWSTNISPIKQTGMKILMEDINLHDFSFDFNKLRMKAKLNKEFERQAKEDDKFKDSGLIKLVFVTHLLGIPADIEGIKKVFPKEVLLEDCCESHGAVINGTKVGNFGLGSTFSFYYGHHMTTIEGGMVCTNDEDLYKLLLLKRSHGLIRELKGMDHDIEIDESLKDSQFVFGTHGYNFRNTELHAALGLNQLKRLDEYIEIRRRNHQVYSDVTSSYKEHLYSHHTEGNSSFCFPFIFKDPTKKDVFKALLEEESIESRPIVGSNLARQPFETRQKLSDEEMLDVVYPKADKLHYNGLYIGNNHTITVEQVKSLDKLLKKVCK